MLTRKENLEALYSAGGNVKWWNCFGKQFDTFLKNEGASLHLPFDPAVLPLDIYSREKSYIPTKTCSRVFVAVLLVIAKTGNNPDVHACVLHCV